MNARDKKLLGVHPDEWGFYNPDEAGFAAVIKRIGTRGRAPTRKPVAITAKEPAKAPPATPAAPVPPLTAAASGREAGPAPKAAVPRKRKPRARIEDPQTA
jgi:hypothetical protein